MPDVNPPITYQSWGVLYADGRVLVDNTFQDAAHAWAIGFGYPDQQDIAELQAQGNRVQRVSVVASRGPEDDFTLLAHRTGEIIGSLWRLRAEGADPERLLQAHLLMARLLPSATLEAELARREAHAKAKP